VLGAFLSLYGSMRFFLEYFREPDAQLGFVLFSLTMGQVLCMAMVVAGIALVGWRLKSGPD
jgi:phosphatidylglycerol:prolipoprotein diacylglycerol transferase